MFWILYKKNVANTDVFSCCYEIQDFFPVSHIQLMSRCAGAGGSRARQLTQAGQWKYSIPWTSCSVYEWGLSRDRRLSALLISMGLNPLLSRSLDFSRSFVFFGILEIYNFGVLRSLLWAWLWISHRVLRKIGLYIVCFPYPLLSLLLSLLLVVLVFPLLPY